MPALAILHSTLGFLYFDWPLVKSACCVNGTGVGRYIQIISPAKATLSYPNISIPASATARVSTMATTIYDIGTTCRSVVVVGARVCTRVPRGHSPPGRLRLLDPNVLPGGIEEGGRGRKQGRAEKPGVADCNRRMHRPIPITIRLDMV